ncbi:MAG TPA: hypothetical protein VEA99_09730 [Gemmatimonadaceae bacterium]|nr:hypothetical protein [Gemmatimonadaceae bacterium]
MSALFLTVAIAAVSLELSLLARQRRLAAANVLEAATARAAAEAGLETVRARLTVRLTDLGALGDPWRESATRIDTVVIGEARARVTLSDLGSRLHLNRATPAELQRLFAASSLDAAEADRLAQRIADWRDADAFPRPNGAERDAYLRAAAPVLPRDAEFRDVDELRDVLGMTPALLARLRPLLTVEGTGRVNVNAAPRAVLLAVPGMTAEAAEVAERARRIGRPIADLQALRDRLSPPARAAIDREMATLAGRLAFETREVLAHSTGWSVGSPVRIVAQAVVARGADAAILTARRTAWAEVP